MNRVQKKFIIDAVDNLEMLSDWENDFILDLAKKEESYTLSEKQNSTLNRIVQKINEA